MKLSEEIKLIPSWFRDFNKSRLIESDVESIRYLIYALQVVAAFALIASIIVIAFAMTSYRILGSGGFGFVMLPMFMASINVAIIEIIILDIQARSKLAFMLVFTVGFGCMISIYAWLGSGVIFYLLNKDEVVAYFFPEKAQNYSLGSLTKT